MKYYKVNPGGNITAIVKSDYSQKEKIKLSKIIMKKDPTIEQVGFWVRAKDKNNDGRLEMAGGEFCGNALRCLAMLIKNDTGKTKIRLESSGQDNFIEATVEDNTSEIKLSLNNFRCSKNSCFLTGIAYFITNKEIIKSEAKKLLVKNYNNFPASGVISYKKNKNIFSIKPIIWVKDIDTLIEETACGSGTMALAYFMYSKYKIEKFQIKQPSNSIFKVFIKSNKIFISGEIISIEEKFLS
ncbi:TPA: hypothetical protein DEW47_00655 [Patescibacteria group bacterium]|nr:MAG: Diaminopimelate epimerase family protein [Parcubacteria group bacterium GW2011_GWF2_40_10]KKR47512.1 MAG: Diaminopimelate epimerase family protein [Parcubacteria group bacterium GW2011_GWA2_40_143]KKR59931.1 MAG: Diaminopimelate epimerase family protein [Parcubacteria group bacterium GW2011_GWC2_40_31]KKR74218.1 MAG: Diaminopimelate epimerase family protein [Parcubacteria group bacterium GW2011_GWB2_40_8]KKR75435.1 MAG: Diaminopimelate epimerase family protein [Parcubacteria group bacte